MYLYQSEADTKEELRAEFVEWLRQNALHAETASKRATTLAGHRDLETKAVAFYYAAEIWLAVDIKGE